MFTKHFSIGWLLAIILILLLCATAVGATSDPLLTAINQVEASGKHFNVPRGDNDKAIGPFQIHRDYWCDSGVAGRWQDCDSFDYSVKVVTAYMRRHEPRAYAQKDYETLARLHNGGPNWRHISATKNYWLRVRKVLTPNQT